MTKKWIFIDSGFNSGNYNMKFDYDLLNSFNPDSSLPVFRLYGWSPPAISLGKFQNPESIINLNRCRKENISTVKRLTGGGAIFHDCEITYSLICRSDTIETASVKESYEKLCGFLLLAYKKLGLQANFAHNCHSYPDKNNNTPFCFSGWEEYDILISDRKIGGNAQKRKKNIVFQHGSIPFKLDIDYIQSFFVDPITCEGKESLSLNECIPGITFTEFKCLLKDSFAENMDIEFTDNS